MIEMPPLQFAQVNGIRMGYYEAGPEVRQATAHSVSRLAGARVFLASPDQGPERGRHPRDRAGSARLRRDRPARAGRGLRHGAPDRRPRRAARRISRSTRRSSSATTGAASSSGRCRCVHLDRVAGVIGVNTPHYDRLPADPIELFRKRFGDSMYIVQFQDPAREPDKIFGSRVEQTFDAFMRKPLPRKDDARPRRRSRVSAHRPRPTWPFRR